MRVHKVGHGRSFSCAGHLPLTCGRHIRRADPFVLFPRRRLALFSFGSKVDPETGRKGSNWREGGYGEARNIILGSASTILN